MYRRPVQPHDHPDVQDYVVSVHIEHALVVCAFEPFADQFARIPKERLDATSAVEKRDNTLP